MNWTTSLQTIHTHAAAVPCGMATLRDGIRDVLSLGADGEMRRIDATWCIAGVQNLQTGWDRATVRQLPRHAMGIGAFPAVNSDLAVAIRPDWTALKDPARRAYNGSRGETLGQRVALVTPAPQANLRLSAASQIRIQSQTLTSYRIIHYRIHGHLAQKVPDRPLRPCR